MRIKVNSPARRTLVGLAFSFAGLGGIRWTVREYTSSRSIADGYRAPCLTFECDDAVRRVVNFPADWRELDATLLLALSWKT